MATTKSNPTEKTINIRQKLMKMKVGAEASFPLDRRDTTRTTTNSLKLSKGLVFTTRTTPTKFIVQRTK